MSQLFSNTTPSMSLEQPVLLQLAIRMLCGCFFFFIERQLIFTRSISTCVRWIRSCFLLWTISSTFNPFPQNLFWAVRLFLLFSSSPGTFLRSALLLSLCSPHSRMAGVSGCTGSLAEVSSQQGDPHTWQQSLVRLSSRSGTSGRKMRRVKTVDLFVSPWIDV